MIFKIIFSFLLLLSANVSFAQKIIISGTEGVRPLKWKDFTGNPDYNSPYFAFTSWTTSFKFKGVQFSGDTAIISGFEITLQLDTKNSWIKKEKESDDLLKHEQGHFDIGILYMKEVLKKVNETSFVRNNFQTLLQSMLADVSKKYNAMGIQYDDETAHSKNKERQEKWNVFFNKQMQEE